MLVTTCRTLVHAQVETVWDVLLDRVENPQNYLHGVEDVKIIERSAVGIERALTWEGKAVRERILPEKDQCRITSELHEHPLYTGTIIIRLAPSSVQNPMAPLYLEADVRLERKSFHLEGMVATEAEMIADLEKELETVKQKAEERERR